MKALILKDYMNLSFEDVSEPDIGSDEVLVRVKACGICGSDVHGMDGSTGRRQPPIVMGHEASGVIAGLGANVTGWKAGDRVTFDSTVYCGTCWYCRRGNINLCDNRKVLGVSCEEYRRDGAYAEYVTVPQHILYRLPDAITFEQAAMVEPVSVAVHAINITPIALNDTAVVIGVGMIGLLVLQALKLAGCGQVIAADVDENRLKLAEQLGADATLKADDTDVMKEVKKLTDGRGADVAVEVVGLAETVNQAIECARKGGTVTLVGNLAPRGDMPLQTIVTRQLRVQGSYASSGDFPACLELISRGAIDVNPLISAAPALSEGAQWFKRLYEKEPGLMKVILQP